MWNSRLSATALPSTSARSQAAIAISHSSQLGQRVHARIPVAAALGQVLAGHDAQPRGDDLQEDRHQAGDSATTQSRPYLNCAPACRSVPQLPGSM